MENYQKKLIAYSDGSCKPNPGYAGYGIFAYTFIENNKLTKYKHPYMSQYYFTENGIIETSNTKPINIDKIYEFSYAIIGNNNTNNLSELIAFTTILEFCLNDNSINEVTIHTDSSYVCTCFNSDLKNWSSNNWKRIDGKDIIHKKEWQKILEITNILIKNGVTINVKWVKGHSDSLGNTIADLLSTIGSNAAFVLNNTLENNSIKLIYSHVCNYKEYCEEHNVEDIIYQFKDIFFSSNPVDDTTYCFLYNADKREDNIGAKTTESIFAINEGFVPEVINKIKKFHRSINRFNHSPCNIKIGKTKNKMYYRYLNLVDLNYLLVRDGNKISFNLVRDTTPFLYDVSYLSPLILNVGSMFKEIQSIDKIQDPDVYNYSVNVFDKFYKNNKLLLTTEAKELDFTEEVKELFSVDPWLEKALIQKLELTIGVDMPSYLALKKIEKKVKDTILVLSLNRLNNTMTCLFKFVLDDRNLLVTNICSKFAVKFTT